MELELKHLTAYLPYNLQIKLGDGREMEVIAVRDWIGWCVTYKSQYGETNIGIKAAKPILRPLSDITKEIEHKGEKFVPIDVLWNETLEQVDSNTYDDHFFNSDLETTWICQENVLQLEQIVVDKLIEWHFDVFGLIPAGLATEKEVSHD